MMRPLALALTTLLLPMMIGCAGTPKAATINHGIVETEDVRIIGPSFELVAGEAFRPPFHTGTKCLLEPSAANYGHALRNGGKKVRVHHPDVDQPLYGVLALCGRLEGASGPASRSYMIQVPSSRVAQTEGGAVSVVYEYHRFTKKSAISKAKPKAWILWLSQLPLEAHEGLQGSSRLARDVRISSDTGDALLSLALLFGGAAVLSTAIVLPIYFLD